jgi:DNA polymerase-1
VIDDEEGSYEWLLEQLETKSREVYTFDIETGYEKDSVFVHPDHLLCVGMAYRGDRAVVLGENALMGSRVRDLLGAFLEVKKVVAHNAKFDFGVMHNLGIINPEVFAYGDTMLGHYCLDERRGTHGLKYLGQELFGAPDWGDVGFKMDRLQDAPRDVLYHYNGIDAAVTYRIWVEILPVLQQGDGLWDLHHRLLAVSHALASTESEGVAVDLAYIGQLTEEFTEELELIERLMFEATGVAHNPRSPKQLMELFSSLWGTKTSTTNVDWLDSRQEQLDSKKGKKAAEEFHYIGLLLDHRKATKLYGTYVKGTAKRTTRGRVYPTYLVHGTTTGRLACRNPNLQNVPRGSRIRRLFIPDEGNTFIQCDYKTAELRVMAVLAGDDYLKGVFADDRDLHSEVATQFWGPDFTKEQRIRAKAVVFGLNYGREAWSLAEEMGISAAEAQRYIDTFFKLIPQVAEWRRSVVKQILSGEPLISPFGRRHRVWLITNQNKKDVIKEGLAFLPQGTASDITMAAFSRLRREGYKTRIPVHDSILVEAPSSSALQVARYVKKVMEETATTEFSDQIPFPVDVEMGDSWGTLEEVKESTLLN